MSKTKTLKRKTTGFDIVYRVVTAIMAILMFPLVYFLDIIYIQMDHTAIADLWGTFTDNKTPDLGVTYEFLSIAEFGDWVDTIMSFVGSDTSSINIWNNSIYRPAIVAIGFLAVALVLGLVILGFACFSNKVKVVTGLSGAGFVCTVISFFCFSEGFAAPIISGEITLAQLLGQGDSSVISLILGVIGEITFLNLESGFFAVMFLMLGILIWSISVMVVNAGEEKEKQAKKLARENRQ